MAKKKFEKELLARFQAAMALLQEGRLAEGVSGLTGILAIEELNSCRYRNADFEKLKAACQLNLYRAYGELRESRKAFYYALKYLEYEQDNYALAYEFGSGLLTEGFLGAALVYLKRALSFALAKDNRQFAEIVLKRLVFAMCMTDDPADLRQLLQLLAKGGKLPDSDLEPHWKSYFTLLNLLDRKSGLTGRFAEETEEWSQSNRRIDPAERAEMERWRTQVQALNAKIRLESVSMDAPRTFPQPDLVQEVVTFKMSRNVTLNEFLKRINKHTDGYEKPVRRQLAPGGEVGPAKGKSDGRNFYDQFNGQVIAIPRDPKASREAPVDPGRVFGLQQEVRQRSAANRKDDTLTYIASLLVHLGADVTGFQREPSRELLVPNPPSSRKDALKTAFYEGVVYGRQAGGADESRAVERGLMEVILQLIEHIFGEKAREFSTGPSRYVFFGPSVFLREDFRVNAREFMALFGLMTAYFAADLVFEELLVYLECVVSFASLADLRSHMATLQRQAHLLQLRFHQFPDEHFEERAEEYLDAQAELPFGGAGGLGQTERPPSRLKGARSVSDRLAALRDAHSHAWTKGNQALVQDLAEVLRDHWEERMEQVRRVLVSEDLATAVQKFADPGPRSLPRSSLLPLGQYWRQPEHIAVTFANHESVLGHLLNPRDRSLNDLEFVAGFLHLDFSELLAGLPALPLGWSYLRVLLDHILRFLGAQGVWDAKQLDHAMEALLRLLSVPETVEAVLRLAPSVPSVPLAAPASQDAMREMSRDAEFQRTVYQTVVTLMSFSSHVCRQTLRLLCRLQLRLLWATGDWLRYVLLYQCLSVHNDTGDQQGALTPVLQSPVKRIKFLVSVRRYLDQAQRRNEARPADAPPVDENYVGMVLREMERFLEYHYGLKVNSGALASHFARVTHQDEKAADRAHVDNYRCPPVKPRAQPVSYSAEEGRVHKDYPAKALLEQLQVFIAFTDTVNCLEKLDPFFFAIGQNEPKFGDCRLFQERNVRVAPHLDLRLAGGVASKVERILRAFADFPDLFPTLQATLAHRKLVAEYLVGGPWQDAEAALAGVDFQANDHLFVFLVLLARFQESSRVEPTQRYEDEAVAGHFGALGSLYAFLHRRYPFDSRDSRFLPQFLLESVSRTQLVASLATFPDPARLAASPLRSAETLENECLGALVKLHKADLQLYLARDANHLFPDLIPAAFLAEQEGQASHCLAVLAQHAAFLSAQGSRRLDFVLLFYFPAFLYKSGDWADGRILQRLDRLVDASAGQDYALNFKAFARDPRHPDRASAVQLLALARFLCAHYQFALGKSGQSGVDAVLHSRAVTDLLQTQSGKRRADSDPTALILDALKHGPATQTGSPRHHDDHQPSPEVEEVSGPPPRDPLADVLAASLASDHFHSVARLYTRMASLMDPRPASFEELWARVFQTLLDFIQRERKNTSGTLLFSLCAVLVTARAYFPVLRDLADLAKAGVPDLLRRFDLSCREKDFKIFHVDLALSRVVASYHSLAADEATAALKPALLHAALRLLKKVEVRPGNLIALGLLLPLYLHLEHSRASDALEFVQAIWDSRSELSKMMQSAPEADFLWKKLFQKALDLILDLVDAKLITQDERTEVRNFREALAAADTPKLDMDGIFRSAKGVRGLIKRHFEEKAPPGPAPARPVPVLQ